MYCQNRIVHTVQEGDSLYRLSRQYHTTVTELILGNPGVNPYNLQIGMRLFVCPGEGYVAPDGSAGGMNLGGANQSGQMPGGQMPGGQMPGGQMPETENEMENSIANMMEAMRLAWLSMLYWTRMYMMSVAADTKDQQAVEERLMEAADEITDVFARTLPIQVVRQLRNLFMEHVELTGDIIRMVKSGNMENYDNLIKEWYANANQIATLFANQNPYFGGRELRNMLLNYLDMTRETIEHQMNGEYDQSIDTFRDLKDAVLELADYLARGLLAR